MKKYNHSLQYDLALEATKAINGTKSYEPRLIKSWFTCFTYEEEDSFLFLDTHVATEKTSYKVKNVLISMN